MTTIRVQNKLSRKYICIVLSCISSIILYFLFQYYQSLVKYKHTFSTNPTINPTSRVKPSSSLNENADPEISLYYRHATAERNSSYPFISGDTFRGFADYVYDETKQDDLTSVKYGDVIFVKTDRMSNFFGGPFNSIKNPFVLITHNSDDSAPGSYQKYLSDSKIIMWYAQNPSEKNHPKVRAIPIGLANRRWGHGNLDKFLYAYKNKRKPWSQRTDLLYTNFDVGTNRQAREKALAQAALIKNGQTIKTRLAFETHLEQLGNTKFVLSPFGGGIDCHRSWETLLMGSVPIVLTSAIDPLLNNTRTVILDDWSKLTEAFLLSLDFSSNDQILVDGLSAQYWRKTIFKHKKV